jgi:hypothetical protein
MGFDNLNPIIWRKISNASYEVSNGSTRTPKLHVTCGGDASSPQCSCDALVEAAPSQMQWTIIGDAPVLIYS